MSQYAPLLRRRVAKLVREGVNKPMIAISGYSRQGKDEAGKALIAKGYRRVAFGDIIRKQLKGFTLKDAVELIDWMYPDQPRSERGRVWKSASDMFTGQIDPFTEVDEEKNKLRALMEWYGMWKYDEILDELFQTLPLPVVNTRLMRVREAQHWVDAGGHVIEVIRPFATPQTEFEREAQQEIRDSGLLSITIVNDGTISDLHQKINDFTETSFTGYQPEIAML